MSQARLYEICRQLRPIQLQYMSARMVVDTDAEAAEAIGISKYTAYNWPEKKLIDEGIELACDNAIMVVMRQAQLTAQKAFDEMVQIMLSSDSDTVRLNACKEILNRAGVTAEAATRIFVPKGGGDGPPSERDRVEALANLFEAVAPEKELTD